jgi:hypothetical protein
VSVPAAFGGSFHPDRVAVFGPAAARDRLEPMARMTMPRFELAALGGIAEPAEPQPLVAPPACNRWMSTPGAQPAERWIAWAGEHLELIAHTGSPRLDLPALGGKPQPLVAPPASGWRIPTPEAQPVERLEPMVRMSMPRLDLAALGGNTEVAESQSFATPPACNQWMPTPGAQPVERWIELAVAPDCARIPFRIPGAPSITGTFLPRVSDFFDGLEPEAVQREVHAILDSTPASSWRGPALLRFGLHAVEEISAPAAQPIQAPAPAGPRRCLEAVPVESMPAVPAFVPAALAPCAAVQMPAIRAIIAQVLPQAWAVAGPAPIPVESFPTAPAMVPAACDFRPALRLPTLAHFQPAEDAAEALAAPVVAPGPSPVESMPFAAAYAPVALPMIPRVAAGSFAPSIRAEFRLPKIAGPAPSIAEPPAAVSQPALLEPMARIAAQPAGAQPERPTPAIPQPQCIPLEYYCQRITSVPTKHIAPIESKVALVRQPFAIPAALGRFDDFLKKKPSRIVLPFEQYFARKKAAGPGKKIQINTAGKIAAAIMVGVALWSGTRLANLGQHTQQLRAQVAASERIVAVGETGERNFGNGPMGKFRRAVADRAATEFTDNFKAGMAAWGAEKTNYAHGWKRDPKGYVSTGEMALFQPSLKYTDYHMEFYGQIEDKSMGWVVRAQDKKNYYAMKFTVIEPGLRPIIAMVHYGVVNGKAGHKVQTPLSVMVHNQKAIQVAVDVRGNHFTASIDGEPIESWTDDTLAQGGVGFFSDAGERARLYWMKLSRNQDWLGRFCAYLSSDGQSNQQVAEVWGPGMPNPIPGPIGPQTPALALAAAGPFKKRKRRSEEWN